MNFTSGPYPWPPRNVSATVTHCHGSFWTSQLQAGVDLVAGNNVGYFGPYERILRGRTRRGYSCGCGAGRTTIGVEADGTIKGCPSLATREWAGGNIRDESLRDIWERATPLRYTRDRTARDLLARIIHWP
jgi:MoaA/NifB/PqqE/SkfB family radical SAM enzyme